MALFWSVNEPVNLASMPSIFVSTLDDLAAILVKQGNRLEATFEAVGKLSEDFEVLNTKIDGIDAKFTGSFTDLNNAMKEGFNAVHLDVRTIITRLDAIEVRLNGIDANIAAMKGYATEIDDLRREIEIIKRHLGIDKKIAA